MIGKEVLDSLDEDTDKPFQNDDWNAIQLTACIGDLEATKALISEGADTNYRTKSMVVPQVSPLHIAARTGNTDVMKLLINHANANVQDQWGFTPLHYATVARSKEATHFLLSNGASAIIPSKSGSTALDLAEQLQFDDIVDALKSRSKLEADPTVPMFREWLTHLGGGEYANRFLEAGYDLPFIAQHGLTDADCDCVGIPSSKMGLRRKISQLHNLSKYYTAEQESGEDDSGGSDSDEGSHDDDDDDDEDDDE